MSNLSFKTNDSRRTKLFSLLAVRCFEPSSPKKSRRLLILIRFELTTRMHPVSSSSFTFFIRASSLTRASRHQCWPIKIYWNCASVIRWGLWRICAELPYWKSTENKSFVANLRSSDMLEVNYIIRSGIFFYLWHYNENLCFFVVFFLISVLIKILKCTSIIELQLLNSAGPFLEKKLAHWMRLRKTRGSFSLKLSIKVFIFNATAGNSKSHEFVSSLLSLARLKSLK